MKVSKEYIDRAEPEHHAAAHSALLEGLNLSQAATEAIHRGPFPHIAHQIHTDERLADELRGLPDREQVSRVKELAGGPAGTPAQKGESEVDKYINQRGLERKRQGLIESTKYGGRQRG